MKVEELGKSDPSKNHCVWRQKHRARKMASYRYVGHLVRNASLQRVTEWANCPFGDLGDFMPHQYGGVLLSHWVHAYSHHSSTGLVYILLVASKNKHNFPNGPFFSQGTVYYGKNHGKN